MFVRQITSSVQWMGSIEEGQRQKKRQRQLLLFGGNTFFNSLPCYSYFAMDDFEEQDEFIPFFQIILKFKQSIQNSYRGKELNKFSPQSEATTFAFSSVFILFLCWGGIVPIHTRFHQRWRIYNLRCQKNEKVVALQRCTVSAHLFFYFLIINTKHKDVAFWSTQRTREKAERNCVISLLLLCGRFLHFVYVCNTAIISHFLVKA